MKKGDLVKAVKGMPEGFFGIVVDIEQQLGLAVLNNGSRRSTKVVPQNWITVCWEEGDAVTCMPQDHFELIAHAKEA